jgi:hypothetical protein
MGSLRFIALGCVVLLLAACSGGGGGGGQRPVGNFSISTTTVTFDGDPDAGGPEPAVVSGSITGVDQTVFLRVVLTTNGVATAAVDLTGPTTGTLTIVPKSPLQLGYGTFTDTITVSACLDEGCGRHISGSPKTINVTYTVRGIRSSAGEVGLRATEGTAPAVVTTTLSNNTNANWTSSITYEGATTGWLAISPNTGATQGSQTVTFAGNVLNTPGTYSATVVFTASNRTLRIPVSYVVTHNIGLDRSAATLSAVTGQTAPPVGANVALTAAAGPTTFTTSVSYAAGASNWLAVTGTSAPGTLTLVPQTVALPPGSYEATVTVTPTTGTPVLLDVTYTLAPSQLTFAPDDPLFTINAASTAAAQFTRRNVATGDTGAPLTWTASESVPWLSVTPAGSSGQNAVLTLNPAALETVRNGLHHAVVTFTYNGPSVVNQTQQLTVDLSLSLPTIEYAMPYVAYLNEQKQLVLRGSGFDQPGGAAVEFGGVDAAQVQLVSDTELRVAPPGSVVANPSRPQITIANALNLPRSNGELVVRARPDYGTQQFDFSVGRSGRRLLYDAERDALFAIRGQPGDGPLQTLDSVLRFALDPLGADPAVFAFQHFDALSDIGLSPDGKTLYVLTKTELHFVSPDLLTELKAPVSVPAVAGFTGEMAVTNDGRILFPFMQTIYSPLTDEFTPVETHLGDTFMGISADGSLVALQPRSISGNVFLGTYDAGTGEFQFQSQERFSALLSVDRTGARIAHGGELFNGDDLTLRGSVGENGGYSLLSTTGNRLYTVTFDPHSRVQVWNTSGNGSTFPELTPIDSTFDAPGMGISLNSEHLFLLDSEHLFIVEVQP